MKVKVVGSSNGDGERQQFLLSYVCNRSVAIDAGCIGFITPVEEQARIKHVFLTHSHLDHTASLPIFLDNVYARGPECPHVYAHAATLESLRTDFFNERVWPDVIELSRAAPPFLRMSALTAMQATVADGLIVTPVTLNHVVPTFAYTVSDHESTVAFVSDTSPCERIWNVLNSLPRLDAVFLEASFPNSMSRVAETTMHLTPRLFAGELLRLRGEIPILAVHVKPAFRETVVRELAELKLPQVQVCVPGQVYDF